MRALGGSKEGAPFTKVRVRGANRISVATAARNTKGYIARMKVVI